VIQLPGCVICTRFSALNFKNDKYLGKVAKVKFSTPKRGSYAYLLGNFNAFNEGSFRMKEKGDRWTNIRF